MRRQAPNSPDSTPQNPGVVNRASAAHGQAKPHRRTVIAAAVLCASTIFAMPLHFAIRLRANIRA
jgi:hypothetical protein